MFRRRLDWSGRASAALATILIDKAHGLIFGGPENTVAGVTVYLASAALMSFIAIVIYAHIIKGQLSFDLQRLSFCAIALQFTGWLLYLAQQSPAIINQLIAAVTYGTFTRILWTGDGDSDAGGWRDLFCRLFGGGASVHSKKAKS